MRRADAVRRFAVLARRTRAVLVQTGKDFFADNAPMWAAAIAYQALLSAFPLFLAAMAVAAYIVDPNVAIHAAATRLGAFLPEGGAQLASIAHGAIASRARTGVLSILAWLWAGGAIFDTLTLALNAAYDVEEIYGLRKRILIDVLMLLTVGLFFVLAVASAALTGLLASLLHTPPESRGFVARAAQASVPPLLLLIAYILIYRFVPRGKQDWRAAFVGAVVATPLFFAARVLFFWFVRQFGQYNLLYGPFAVAVILVFWAWIVALITLFAGELAGHVQQIFLQGQSAEEVGRRHAARTLSGRRAPTERAADRAGPS